MRVCVVVRCWDCCCGIPYLALVVPTIDATSQSVAVGLRDRSFSELRVKPFIEGIRSRLLLGIRDNLRESASAVKDQVKGC